MDLTGSIGFRRTIFLLYTIKTKWQEFSTPYMALTIGSSSCFSSMFLLSHLNHQIPDFVSAYYPVASIFKIKYAD